MSDSLGQGNRHRAQSPRRAGATLVDLVITVLILGILAAVAAPRFAVTLAKLRAEAGARRIAGDLNLARRTAMLTSRPTSVTFRSAPPGYDMTAVEHPAYPGQVYQVNLADISSNLSFVSYGFNTTPSISFNSYGRPLVGGAPLTAGSAVVSSGGQSFTVTVSPATGEASAP